jgi:hypothetical protein
MKHKEALLLVTVFFLLSCLFDHLTTFYGLTLPTLAERNPVVLRLIEAGIWHKCEAFIIVSGILYGILAVASKSISTVDISTKTLMIAGFIRFLAGFQNLTMII